MKQLICVALISMLLVACHKDEERVPEPTLGKYIYRDDNDIHHINPNCFKLRNGKDEAGHEIYAKHLIDTSEFVILNPKGFRVCTRCVSDMTYNHLRSISVRNREVADAKQRLYDNLVQANYDMPDFDSYCKRLKDPEVRRRLYLIAQEEWNEGKTEEEFSNHLGY